MTAKRKPYTRNLPDWMVTGAAARGTADDWARYKTRRMGVPEPATDRSARVAQIDALIVKALMAKAEGKRLAATLVDELAKRGCKVDVKHLIARIRIMQADGVVQRINFAGDGAMRMWKTDRPGMVFVRIVTHPNLEVARR